jgi:Protein of unknown function (DUF2917)
MMNRSPESFETSVTLDATPRPLRLPLEAAVYAVRGTIWITQERLLDDIILAAGERFDVKRDGLILASAVKGTAAIHIVRPADARAEQHRNIYDFARARAARLRREALGHFARLVNAGAAAWFARARTMLTARPRAVSH